MYGMSNHIRSRTGRLVTEVPAKLSSCQVENQTALCLRFRNEARYLREWIEYYRFAGITKFYLYNNFSSDDYHKVLSPYIQERLVELIDWPFKPASPSAEEDCIRRARGKFAWVGFLDADEFLVIRSGESIPAFLSKFSDYPAAAFHWYFFGSNGRRARPDLPVTEAYTRRFPFPNAHVKCFVQPYLVTQCRNPHSWYYYRAKTAVTETHRKVFGSLCDHATANSAWINHYYAKSEEDYREKMGMDSSQDANAIRYPSRRVERLQASMLDCNEIEDRSAIEYLKFRRALTQCALNRASRAAESTPSSFPEVELG